MRLGQNECWPLMAGYGFNTVQFDITKTNYIAKFVNYTSSQRRHQSLNLSKEKPLMRTAESLPISQTLGQTYVALSHTFLSPLARIVQVS